jgi:blocked-early-in-transport protein 1
VKDQNSFLDKAATDFSNTSNLLSGTVKKVQQMLASGGSKHMCHLVCFVVGVFFLLYFLMKWKS